MASGKEKIFKEISVYLDRIEDLEDGTSQAVLLIDDGEEDYSGEVALPLDFLPEDSNEGEYLKIKIFRAENNESSRLCVDAIEDEDAILIFNDAEKIYVPVNFLPEDSNIGDYLEVEIFRDDDKTNAALDEARQLLKELE